MAIAILICLLGISHSYATKPVHIAVDYANPPFMYEMEGKAAGLYPAITEALFQYIQVPVAIKALPWKRALMEADKGDMGIAGIYKTKERLKKYDYSHEIFKEKLVIFILKENAFPFKNIRDLRGKKIGVIRGWSYGDEFDAARKEGLFQTEETKADDQNFGKLVKNRIDCVLAIEESGQQLLAQPIYKEKIIQLNQPVTVNATYIIFPKKAKQKALISKIDAALDKMKATEEYNVLVQKVFSQH